MRYVCFIILFFSSAAFAQNRTISSFSEAKKIRAQLFPSGQTLYCGCSFRGKITDNDSCGYSPKYKVSAKGNVNKRAGTIEDEHVVPAENFGRSFAEWRDSEGFAKCNKSGRRKMSNRQCAGTNQDFAYMEADLYNLYPENGDLNGLRSNHDMGEVAGEAREFGRCNVELKDGVFEPRDEVKGIVARTYLYMHHAYPQANILGNNTLRKTMEIWNRTYPVSNWEKERARKIMNVQGNCNPFVLQCE